MIPTKKFNQFSQYSLVTRHYHRPLLALKSITRRSFAPTRVKLSKNKARMIISVQFGVQSKRIGMHLETCMTTYK